VAKQGMNIEKDLERIKKRLLAGKKSLHQTRVKTEQLDSFIRLAIRAHRKHSHS
jgi:hypothetical protein